MTASWCAQINLCGVRKEHAGRSKANENAFAAHGVVTSLFWIAIEAQDTENVAWLDLDTVCVGTGSK